MDFGIWRKQVLEPRDIGGEGDPQILRDDCMYALIYMSLFLRVFITCHHRNVMVSHQKMTLL